MKRSIIVFIFLFFTLPLVAADEWVKLTSPHFELLTTAGERKGREAILYFEQVRGFFEKTLPSKHVSDFPVRIVAFRSEKQYKPYRVNEVAIAYFTSTRTRDYIVMQDIAPEHYQTAIHEYTHLIIEHSGLKLPLWMNEGWAELYSSLKANGNKTIVGDVHPGRLQELFREKWLDLQELTSADHNSSLYNEKNRAGIFYAESWALMHMLFLGNEYRANFSKFVLAVAGGQSFEAASQKVYGKGTADVQKELQGYFRGNHVMAAVFDVKLQKSEQEAQAAAAQPLEVELALADILAATNKTEQARQEYERIAKENPGNSEVESSLGYLAWRAQDSAGARAHFGKAFAAGSRDAQMCFDYAMLERNAAPHSDTMIPALARAIEIKPDYIEAKIQLGLVYLNSKQWGKAVEQLTAIHNVKEEQAFWLFSGLAYAQAELGGLDEARANIEKAKKWAKTDAQVNQADSLVRFLDARKGEAEVRAHPETQRPAAIEKFASPEPDAPPPTFRRRESLMRVEGMAKSLECINKRARLHVNVAGADMVFAIDDPGQVILKHEGDASFEFKCGPQKPFKVAVEYAAAPEGTKGVAGVVRVLEF